LFLLVHLLYTICFTFCSPQKLEQQKIQALLCTHQAQATKA
jgi:hypothetical protein